MSVKIAGADRKRSGTATSDQRQPTDSPMRASQMERWGVKYSAGSHRLERGLRLRCGEETRRGYFPIPEILAGLMDHWVDGLMEEKRNT